MTAIADAELQRLFAAAINEQQLTQGIVNTAHDAFCAALNERLEEADRMAQRIEWSIRDLSYKAPEQVLERALENLQALTAEAAAYRQSKERT